MVRFIKIGKGTAAHKAILEAKGYEVEEVGGVLQVTCSEVIEGSQDLSTPELYKEAIGSAIASNAVFSYKTKFKFPDGKVLYGVMACTHLGKASALVTKGEPKVKSCVLNDIFDAL